MPTQTIAGVHVEEHPNAFQPDAGDVSYPAYSETETLTGDTLDALFRDDHLPVRERFAAVAADLSMTYPYEVGRTRIVFHVTASEVVKVPRTEEGMLASSGEAHWSEKNGKTGYIPVADTRIDFIDDVPVLRMEKIRHPTKAERRAFPDWTGSVDCAQVGYDRHGVLVAFDL